MRVGGYTRVEPFARLWSADDWFRKLQELGVPSLRASQWAEPFAAEVQPGRFSAGLRDLLDWLPQCLHETGMLGKMVEDLDYSAARICQVWPGRFPSEAAAAPFAGNPEALANRVYGGRMGNVQAGDGWQFRGRGLIMATGRASYRRLGELMGQDLEGLPNLLEGPRYAIEAAIAWWEGSVPDVQLGDQVRIRRRVNGGEIGLAHCEKLAELCRRVLA